MPQIKITLTDEEINLLQTRANKNLNSMSKEARVILHCALYNTSVSQPISGIEFPAFDLSNTHAYTQITPPGVQPAASQTVPSQTVPSQTAQTVPAQITPDPNAGSIDVPAIDDYTQLTPSKPEPKRIIGGPDGMPTPTTYKKPKSTVPVLTDLEVEQVDNEWDAEGYEYSTEEFLIDLHHLEDKLREDVPTHDPTIDPDYVALKNYFIKHDLRERFRSLLSDPSRFYPEEGVYEQPQIKYAQAAFRREKIDYDYIVALLSGTGADYRSTNKSKLYVDEY